jgi:hypothetical protein
MGAAQIVGAGFHQTSRCLRRVAEFTLPRIEKTGRHKSIKETRKTVLGDAQSFGQGTGPARAAAEIRENLELHAGQQGVT